MMEDDEPPSALEDDEVPSLLGDDEPPSILEEDELPALSAPQLASRTFGTPPHRGAADAAAASPVPAASLAAIADAERSLHALLDPSPPNERPSWSQVLEHSSRLTALYGSVMANRSAEGYRDVRPPHMVLTVRSWPY